MKNLAQIMTELREQKGISREQLAILAGIKEAHILRIENNETTPTMPTVFRLCRALEIGLMVLADKLSAEFRSFVAENFQSKVLTNR